MTLPTGLGCGRASQTWATSRCVQVRWGVGVQGGPQRGQGLTVQAPQNHLQILLLLVFEAMVYRCQEYHRRRHQLAPLPAQAVCAGGTRQQLDQDLPSCLKYFVNFFFYKFGLEVRRVSTLESSGDRAQPLGGPGRASAMCRPRGPPGGMGWGWGERLVPPDRVGLAWRRACSRAGGGAQAGGGDRAASAVESPRAPPGGDMPGPAVPPGGGARRPLHSSLCPPAPRSAS